MYLRLLGQIEVSDGQQWHRAGPAKQSAVLAVLAMTPGRAVTQDVIVNRVWGADVPIAVNSALYSYVARLRRLLPQDSGARIVKRGRDGYQLDVDTEAIDLFAMRAAAERAQGLAGVGEHRAAIGQWRAAREHWHGRPLDNVAGGWAERMRESLHREYLTVLEGWCDSELAAGGHAVVVEELATFVDQHPTAEGLVSRLMHAMYRGGRQTEALARFAQVSTRLREEYGIEPGPRLQQMQRRILRHDPELDPGPAAESEPVPIAESRAVTVDVPRQLPAATAGFVGRTPLLSELDERIPGPTEPGRVVAVTGMAGVGKTALTVHWGHRVAERFGHGQLFADLRGFDRVPPREPAEVLVGFLRGLGVPHEAVPDTFEERVALYRSRTAHRGLLVVLDNAASAEQVRPLLPVGPGSLTVVSSRSSLAGLTVTHGARRIAVTRLDTDEAEQLLTETLGRAAVTAESSAVADLIRLCEGLPLAIRIAAAQLGQGSHTDIAEYVASLTEGSRLVDLTVSDDAAASVTAAFALSYRKLPEPVGRMFRLLSRIPGPTFTPAAVAALTGQTEEWARTGLRGLAEANLVEPIAAQRYRLHDLLREYAGRQATDAAEREAASRRLVDWYIASSRAAVATMQPDVFWLLDTPATSSLSFDSSDAGIGWLDDELTNLIAAARHVLAAANPQPLWRFASTLAGYLRRRSQGELADRMLRTGLERALAAGDREAELSMRLGLCLQGRATGADDVDHARIATELLDTVTIAAHHQATVLATLGAVLARRGRLDEAMAACRGSIERAETAGEPVPWNAFNILGVVARQRGRLDEAVTNLRRAVSYGRDTDNEIRLKSALANLSLAYADCGRLDEAEAAAEEASGINAKYLDRGFEANVMDNLIHIHTERGDREQALRLADRALSSIEGAEDDNFKFDTAKYDLLTRFAEANRSDPDQAHTAAETAVKRVADSHKAMAITEAWLALARTRLWRGGDAAEAAELALSVAKRHGYTVLRGKALLLLAESRIATDDAAGAVEFARAAVALHRDSGHRLGEARGLAVLAELEPETATEHAERARELFAACGSLETVRFSDAVG